MPNYSVYGIHLQSNTEISGLPRLDQTIHDISVNFDSVLPEHLLADFNWDANSQYYCSPDFDEENNPHLIVHLSRAKNLFHFQYATGVRFICDREGTQAWGAGYGSYGIDDAALYFLGPILGFMLRLKGITCLHASCMAIGKQALAVAGASGAGKSTIAAAFAIAGYPLLTEDLLPLEDKRSLIHAIPGHPRIKLWPETHFSDDFDPANLPRLTDSWEKRYLDLTETEAGFLSRKLPLTAIYLLDQSDTNHTGIEFSSLSPQAALPLLASNTYRNELLDKNMRAQEFSFLAKLVRQVPVKQIRGYRAPGQLSVFRDLLLDDFKNIV